MKLGQEVREQKRNHLGTGSRAVKSIFEHRGTRAVVDLPKLSSKRARRPPPAYLAQSVNVHSPRKRRDIDAQRSFSATLQDSWFQSKLEKSPGREAAVGEVEDFKDFARKTI